MKVFFRKLLGQKIINYYHLASAILANLIFGFPSKKLHIIAVTGTDGKTTTANLIASILREAGFRTALLSSINAQIGDKIFDTGLHVTTPSPFLLQKLLKKMVEEKIKYVVLEVTSHALDQYRTWGIDFETAVLTNITEEHLDYHKTYENYVSAKSKLFRGAKNIILNQDDKSFQNIFNIVKEFPNPAGRNIITYGVDSEAMIRAENIQADLHAINFFVNLKNAQFRITLNLPGSFNVYNALAAIAVSLAYKIPGSVIRQGLAAAPGIAGRMEYIQEGQDFLAMVDFAHTPNALLELLDFLRPKIFGRIILVFGAAGLRDLKKRPQMGQVADKYADLIIITREDNRSEDIQKICEQIASGIKSKFLNQGYFIIPDRREAIRFALSKAQKNDIVIASGKGHEQSLNVDGQEILWDDRKVIREELKKVVSSE